MRIRELPPEAWEKAREVLGVSAEAGDEELRAAYLEQVRRHPPDRDPEPFERIRDAYELLRDPRLRARQILVGSDPLVPLENVVAGVKPRRKFVGPGPWVAVLKESRS